MPAAAAPGRGGTQPGATLPGTRVSAWKCLASQESDNLVANSGPGCTSPLDGYSELFSNTSLGTIPCKTELYIAGNGKVVKARKVDSGTGSSFGPAIGLYPAISQALFGTTSGGSFDVTIWRADGQPLQHVTNGTQVLIDPATLQTVGGGSPTSLTSGAATGAGGTGTSPNQAQPAPFSIGSTASPHEDFWTAINRLAQERQWYVFSDSETLYLADGADLMQQPPALTLDRWADSDRIVDIEFTWDNSAFQYTASRIKKKHHVQHKSTLAKVASPVECTLHVICDIDEIRAGDLVKLSGCGPGDGNWLVGDCTRSVFNIYSELTLVPAVAALTEQEVSGTNSSLSGAQASAPGSGTVISAMISAAATINNQHVPYVYGGGHGHVGTPDTGRPGAGYDGHTKGYDCSGAVAAVLAAGGVWTKSSVGSETDIISTLKAAGTIVPGVGSGTPECTLWDNPGQHIFMRLNGKFWGTSDGGGQPTSGGGTGGAWLSSGSDSSSPAFHAYHIPQNILVKPLFNSSGSAAAGGGAAVNPAPGATWGRLDMGFDGDYGPAGAVAPYNGVVHDLGITGGWPGNGSQSGGPYFYIVNDNQSGPDYTRAMYFAEGANCAVPSGTHVLAGQKIGNPIAQGGTGAPGNFEIGPAQVNGGDTLTKVYGNNSPGARAMVLKFYNWMRSLGAGATTDSSAAGGP